jgi:uncharacterized membrane protein YesL
MAGFFGLFDYNKPGPGIDKDAPQKSPIVRFFEILQRKFWNLIKVNMMFLIFNIPAIIVGLLVLLMFFPSIIPNALTNADAAASDMILKFILLTLMMCVPMVTVGPAQAGFTYIMRNYSREEHAFLWSDFKDTALKNFKQSMIIGTINFFAAFLMLFVITVYNSLIRAGQLQVLLGTVFMTLMVVMFVIFAMMNLYIYPVLVTFKLNIKQIYKNAFIFAMMKFLPNLGILLLSAFILLFSFGQIILFNPIIGAILYVFLTVSFIGFLTNFYVYPKLEKYMISRLEEEDEEDEEDGENNDEDSGEAEDDDRGDNNSNEAGLEEETTDSDIPGNGEDKEIKRYF